MIHQFLDLMQRGGAVMWPILALSVVAVALAFERVWFWGRTNNPGALARTAKLAQLLRRGDVASARVLAEDDPTVYGGVARALLEEEYSDALATAAVEAQRPRLERYMATLSTIITAAPMLGILGTVTGIIASFRVLSDQVAATDPRSVSAGIAEALLTTAAGLVVAIFVLLPYNACRAQIDRTLGRLETLVAAAAHGRRGAAAKTGSLVSEGALQGVGAKDGVLEDAGTPRKPGRGDTGT